ncbi:zinc-binding dehydrogenase [Embleya sp. NPDC050493]|uniref:zinc-binding dehydrogenase n=1 Tax=Embleya sp. NPDC050493 TaxID=3363989 RepID=UPI0037AA8E08
MRAVRNTDEGVRVVRVPEPEVAGDPADNLLVDVVSTAICGSDLHMVTVGMAGATLGHEFAGTLADGTPVAVRPQAPCGACDLCTSGHRQLCRTGGERLYGVAVDGGMADRVVVDASMVFPLPVGVEARDAALVEPLAVALHGVNRAGPVAGRRVLIVGGGPIGLCAVACARHAGAEVTLAEPQRHRAEAGEALGARIGARGEYDVVIDAAGVQPSFDLAVEHTRPGGTLGLLGTFWTPVTMSVAVQMKEIGIIPAVTYGHHQGVEEFATSVEVLRDTPRLAEALVTHRFGLDDAAEAFARAADPSAEAIKIILEP